MGRNNRRTTVFGMAFDPGKIRLYVENGLAAGVAVDLSREQGHYLRTVKRQKTGDTIHLFNGCDGEWRAEILNIDHKTAIVKALVQSRPQLYPPDLMLVIACIKRELLETVVQKATELGVRHIQPVQTARTVVGRINSLRLSAIVIEAAEQSERLDVPTIGPVRPLAATLTEWPDDRPLVYCDESGGAGFIQEQKRVLGNASTLAVLIGPEGGFTGEERQTIRDKPYTVPVSLGPRILRVDTAAISALALCQSIWGDWA